MAAQFGQVGQVAVVDQPQLAARPQDAAGAADHLQRGSGVLGGSFVERGLLTMRSAEASGVLPKPSERRVPTWTWLACAVRRVDCRACWLTSIAVTV